jgi:hypothetical protein
MAMSPYYLESVEVGRRFQQQNKSWAGYDVVKYQKKIRDLVNRYNARTILDYGCGKGFSIPVFRNRGIIADGADIYPLKLDHYMQLKDAFEHDIVVACEVVEHFTNPKASFKHACSLAREAFAFQTAYYDGESGRDWWYLGPANGHTSLYSKRSLEILAEQNNAKKVNIKDGYYGVQAWHF